MEKKPNVSITQHVNDFTTKAGQLQESGIEIPNELLSIMLLNSLPEEYENFSVAMESRDNIPTLEILKAKLKEEEARQSDRDAKTGEGDKKCDALLTKESASRGKYSRANSRDGSTKLNPQKFDGKCFNCNKMRHRSRDCRAKLKQNRINNTDNALTVIACNAELVTKSEAWCLDSGATRHMCNSKRKFETLNKSDQLKVYTASEHYMKSVGSGNVNLNIKASYKNNPIKIQNALYVPELRNNLLSVSSITDKGHSVIFKKNNAIVKRKDGSTFLTATKQNEIYVIDEKIDRAMLANNEKHRDLLKWHQRYGHVNISDLKKMKTDELVAGMSFTADTQLNCFVSRYAPNVKYILSQKFYAPRKRHF